MSTEALLTIKNAAQQLNLPYWKLLRAANDKLIPSYTLYNTRKYVKISDIEAVLDANPAARGES